jgi:hypothetical protein
MSSATQKWFDIFIDVVTYEATHLDDGELLSEACDRWIERYPTLSRLVIVAFGWALTWHLANLTPPQYDVIGREFWRRLYRLWKKFGGTNQSE